MKVISNKMDGAIDRSQSDWYRDAIIYQMHVKAFQDSNDDGMGDFAGLMRRLDYIQDLGVTAIWILPFYPSPLRDDGYDIADYRSINPSYGTMRDFKAFVAEAHRRGLRVITELVINHTSDQHPWFQKARHAKPGSAARDFYVWSDADTKFPETRIIFLDTETSNWTWDPVAGQFFWHRFYSHQPDLNFDNPRVLREVLKVMHMWLDAGVDGLRLDAIPYLVEREGTNNENLPETHEVLKKIRTELDAHYSDRMLLAEANQWPEDTRPYFGEGDECHMGFHFPLMPRIYMALAQEDRYPISDIIRQTPEIPEGCQWGIFLRNHDELTLEMVSDQERDYLWRTYAEDKRARINLGIRRRLAPLLQNDRRKIELLNSLLMSMPGTPIVYYGDELGMGDNYYLGDRDGVRTPMQWSPDLNAGFSRANPQQLYLPVIMDPIYGYQAVNAESQQRDPSSLLNWMRKLISVRKQHAAFGRGTLTLLYPRNRKVLAYIREYGNDRILCVANLSRQAQAVELDLSKWKGAVPIELTGRSPFPPVGDLPYLLTLPAYGFYWLLLAEEAEAPSWHQQVPDILPEFITLTTRDGKVSTALSGSAGATLESEALPQFLRLQRWFAAKDQTIKTAKVVPLAEMERGKHLLAECQIDFGEGIQRYLMPLSARWGEENLAFGSPTLSYTLAKLRQGPKLGALLDSVHDEDFGKTIIAAMQEGASLEGTAGTVSFDNNGNPSVYAEAGTPRPLGVEQSNVSIAFGDSIILKVYRRLRSGVQPEVEMARFLTNVGHFDNMPAYLGAIELAREGDEPTVLASAFEFVRNQGDAWEVLSSALQRDMENADMISTAAPVSEEEENAFFFPLNLGETLGRRTAELHRALATETDDEAFKAEKTGKSDVKEWVKSARADLDEMMKALKSARSRYTDRTAEMIGEVLDLKGDLSKRLDACLSHTPSGGRSRIHGDYHLGQVLVAADDIVIIDFEGEPRRSIEERRAKMSPLRDVAGMLRSIDYLAADVTRRRGPMAVPADDRAVERAELWRQQSRAGFIEAYNSAIEGSPTHPDDEAFARDLLDLFLIQKAAYEVSYELANRPTWVDIPLRGLLDLVNDNNGAAS
ncbi:maltose alpha-D-glucosyltransferase [Aquibium oceanicum]|uniref:maltose alpha-D-glucosyltransferase n=1 Tax=Aquibium oceanicum TaxID=1670800 RepID=A0A1L3SM23_9HYPH|nr:maltose alpha-D-glucosyltransferase [Aquibium oceanicum]APH70420.1 maltose alpha-D-glucosyltransferase [Aquibium oceanicum]